MSGQLIVSETRLTGYCRGGLMTSDKASGEAILPSIFLLLSLLDREPPLLGGAGLVGSGDLAEARLFAFPRGSIWYGACQYRSLHGPRGIEP